MAHASPYRCFQHLPNFILPCNILQNPNNATNLFRLNQLCIFICEMNMGNGAITSCELSTQLSLWNA
jgi:hypothetical protein